MGRPAAAALHPRKDGSMATQVNVDNFVRAETDRMFAALSARARDLTLSCITASQRRSRTSR